MESPRSRRVIRYWRSAEKRGVWNMTTQETTPITTQETLARGHDLCRCGNAKKTSSYRCRDCYFAARAAGRRGLVPSKSIGYLRHIVTRKRIHGINDYTPGRYADIAYYAPNPDGYWEMIESEARMRAERGAV